MSRMILTLFLSLFLALPLAAQQGAEAPQPDRSATGGAQTLEDVLARQRGERIDDSFRRKAIGNPDNAADMAGQLGTLGGASDAEVWRALRYGLEDVKVSAGGPEARVLIQDAGMRWLEFRKGPLATYGAWLLGATIVLLAVFYLIRGKIRIDGAKTGRTVTRFQAVERFGHWLMAGSFIVLAVTGLLVLFGRMVIIPLLGREAFSTIAVASKWVHNNIAWAFMLGLVMVFVMWVAHNIPNRVDLKWLAVGGGIFTKGVHPPAKKFNAGQKMIFWSVIVFGASISASGLSLLFPFELPMFAKTFVILNNMGLPQLVGLGPLPEILAPHEEMQLASLWHTIMAFVLIAIILAHIYIGSVGMEGAFDAMGSGEVEEQWAREHHGLWLAELQEKGHAPDTPHKAAHPAE
ncbi:formate dehydrogenase subunit gamma [Roseovarius autotrophicus]|uniref:formate dehydrogenase subunit gamma n=1 Tax=Roseovarius autotrophicus TaxID=2824121 RepID=UPI001A05734E|nr:formate dehydrogenase subunit gamma [Roseovarius autotrophicus]MBE0452604.1 formate dehydrogenase subunit gamma [Roseovarius sp.]